MHSPPFHCAATIHVDHHSCLSPMPTHSPGNLTTFLVCTVCWLLCPLFPWPFLETILQQPRWSSKALIILCCFSVSFRHKILQLHHIALWIKSNDLLAYKTSLWPSFYLFLQSYDMPQLDYYSLTISVFLSLPLQKPFATSRTLHLFFLELEISSHSTSEG